MIGLKSYRDDTIVHHTMSVRELREVLAALPDDMPVVGYWDDINWPVKSAAVETLPSATLRDDQALVLNVSSLP